MWNVINVDRYRLRSILLPLLFEVCTGTGPVVAISNLCDSTHNEDVFVG